MSLKDKTIVVTGGSRGLGLGLVEALVDQGAKVTVVARDQAALAAVEQRLGVAVISGRRHRRGRRPAHPRRRPPGHPGAERRRDAAHGPAGPAELGGLHRAVGDRREGRALLDAGRAQPAARAGKPRPGGLERRGARTARRSRAAMPAPSACSGSWPSTPMGSPSRRGWASASRRSCLMQIIGGTGVGDEASSAYARAMGIEREAFLARFGAPMPPRQFGDHLVAVLDDPQYATGFAFGLKGDTGITVLEGEAA